MGGVDGCCGAASGEREGDRERAEAPSGAPLRVSIECLESTDENDRAQFLASETEKIQNVPTEKKQRSSTLGCATLVLHATLAGALPAHSTGTPACPQTLIFGRPKATHRPQATHV